MNAKKIIALLLVVLMSVFTFASCGGDTGNGGNETPKTAAEVIAAADAALESAAYQMTIDFDLTTDNEDANDAFQSMFGDMTMVNSVNGDDLKLDMSMMGITAGLVYVDGVVYLNSGSEKIKFAATEEQLAEITATTTLGGDIGATDFNTLTLEEVEGKQVVTATDIKTEAEEKLDSMLGMMGSLAEDVDISDLALVATVKDGKYESLVVSFNYTTSGITVTTTLTSTFAYDGVVIAAPADAADYEETTFDEIYGGGSVEYIFSHDEYIAAGEDTEVTIIAYVQGKQSWWSNKATIYAQDKDGGYFLYETVCDEATYAQLTPGMKIKVKGYTSSWAGMYEIMAGTIEVIDDGDTYIADAVDITDIYGDEEVIDYQTMKVALSSVTVVASVDDAGAEHAFFYGDDNSGSAGEDIYFNVEIDGETYTLALEKYLTADGTDVYEAAEALKIGDTINVEGFLYWWNGPQIHVTSIATVE